MPILPTLQNIASSKASATASSALFKEAGTDVLVRCSQSHGGGVRLRTNMCKFNENEIVNATIDFPIMVIVSIKRHSSCLSFKDHIYDHRAMKTFWIPYDDIVSDEDATNIISKLICLMNVIPMLNEQSISYSDTKTSCTMMLTNKDSLISKIMNFARGMKECPSNENHWYMTLGITKVTYLPHENFMNSYSKMGHDYNWNAWKKTQEVLDSRIAAFKLLKKIEIKKMKFRASEFKDCNLLDMCSICHDGFLEGCMVSCINKCCHVYHDTCILEWLLRNRSCPICRAKLA